MADRSKLAAERRELFGRRCGSLRRAGILPATVYGPGVDPLSIQVSAHDASLVLRRAGKNQLIDLLIDGQPARPVFVRQTTNDARRNSVLHIEFFQANLKVKMIAHIPLRFVGDSPAAKDGGVLLHVVDHVDIESLPQDVPPSGLEVDVSQLEEIGSHLAAGDLSLPAGVTLITAPDEVIARVNAPAAEEEVEEVVAEGEAAAAESAEGAPAGEEKQPEE